MPLHFPNRYSYATIEKRGGSKSYVEQALFVISRVYLWAEYRGVNVDDTLYYGEFLSLDQISDLVDFLQFTSACQKQILKRKVSEFNQSSHFNNVLNFGSSSKFVYDYTSDRTYANRLRGLKKFLKWIVVERNAQNIQTPISIENRLIAIQNIISNSIPRVSARSENEALEALDLSIEERLAEVLHPNHPNNPFSTIFHKKRNFLLILLLMESGARREEVYHTTSKDIITGSLQYDIKVSKTTPNFKKTWSGKLSKDLKFSNGKISIETYSYKRNFEFDEKQRALNFRLAVKKTSASSRNNYPVD